MCKSVYPNLRPELKWSDTVMALPLGTALITVCCEACHATLCTFPLRTQDVEPIAATIPHTFCLCGMTTDDLLAVIDQTHFLVRDRIWTQFLGNIAHAAMIAGAALAEAEECVELASQHREQWEAEAQAILRDRFLSGTKEKIKGGTYHVPGEAIAEKMILRTLIRKAVAA